VKPILEIRNISKKFLIDHERPAYLSMRDMISSAFKPRPKKEEFWALKDVSFDVMPGESIGIIGRNGAGKSTLLKILSRITPPTEGSIKVRGRFASLLEVGTGFHQELTGRENIFMNGSILGMKRAEIKSRFDEIVDFSGVEKFLDTPLKNYSSGMQLRLAFAVAAHLEPEILIIDEVLAVGDYDFQKKCMGKMADVSKSGRTILFVSHNLDAVEALCKISLVFAKGKLIAKGSSSDLINTYISSDDDILFKPAKLSCDALLQNLSFSGSSFVPGDPLHFQIKIKKTRNQEINFTDFCLLFYNYKKQRVAVYDLRPFLNNFKSENDDVNYEGKIGRFNLIEGNYHVGLYYGLGSVRQDVYDLMTIQIKNENEAGIKPYDAQYRGFVELS
jgi:ABC-type polysaccharide/polyol phosphate transport system ATPase subunit